MKESQTLALLLSVMLCLFMFISAVFVISESDHDCIGEECHICVEIEACVSAVKSLGMVLVCAAAVLTVRFISAGAVSLPADNRDIDTPISLKVKLTI